MQNGFETFDFTQLSQNSKQMDKCAAQIGNFIVKQVAKLVKIVYVYFKPNLEAVPPILSGLIFKTTEGLELTNV